MITPWYLRSVSLYAALAAAETLSGGEVEEEEGKDASFFFSFFFFFASSSSVVPCSRFWSNERMKSLARLSHRRPLASDLAPRSAPRSISSSGIEKRRRKVGSAEAGEVKKGGAAAPAAPPPLAAAASFPRLRAFSSLSMLPPTSERTMAARAGPKWPR